MKDIRLLPLVIVAVGALFALKGVGMMVGGDHLIGGGGPALAQDGAAGDTGTGAAENAAGGTSDRGADGETAAADEAGPSLLERVLGGDSPSRDAVLENLSDRREELEERAKELDLRENLLKATEQRVEKRIAELKAIEDRIAAARQQRSDAEMERLENVVTMYENMKPKDAARIFNDLDLEVVVDVAGQMGARQMAAVLAEMDSRAAQRLTLELSAGQENRMTDAGAPGSALPKIVGTEPAD